MAEGVTTPPLPSGWEEVSGGSDTPPPLPSGWEPVSESQPHPGLMSRAYEGAKGVQVGQLKAAGDIATKLGALVAKMGSVPGLRWTQNIDRAMGSAPGAPGMIEQSFEDASDRLKPEGPAQNLGFTAGKLADYSIPALLSGTGPATFAGRLLSNAGMGAGVAGVESGADPESMALGGLAGAGGGAVLEGAGAAVKPISRVLGAGAKTWMGKTVSGSMAKAAAREIGRAIEGEAAPVAEKALSPTQMRAAAKFAAEKLALEGKVSQAAADAQQALKLSRMGVTSGTTPAPVQPIAPGVVRANSPSMPLMMPQAVGTGLPSEAPIIPQVHVGAPSTSGEPLPTYNRSLSEPSERGQWNVPPATATTSEADSLRADVVKRYADDPNMQRVLLNAIDKNGLAGEVAAVPASSAIVSAPAAPVTPPSAPEPSYRDWMAMNAERYARNPSPAVSPEATIPPSSSATTNVDEDGVSLILPKGQRAMVQTGGGSLKGKPKAEAGDVMDQLRASLQAEKARQSMIFASKTPSVRAAIVEAAQRGDYALVRKLMRSE